jgi:tetratricopeptide (TPR) repeat protein
MSALVSLLLALGGATIAQADGARELPRALRQEREGDPAGALATIEGVLGEAPDGALADDALFHAGRILEERLARPAEALTRYRELLARFPHSRLARRAETRAAALEATLPAGEGSLVELETILATPDAELGAGVRRMEALLARGGALGRGPTERALLWLAGAHARLGQPGRALARWEQVARESRGRPAAIDALAAVGATTRDLGRPAEAERAYHRLASIPGGRTRALRGLATVAAARTRRDVARGAGIALAAITAVLAGIVVRRRGWAGLTPGAELAFLAPVLLSLLGLGLAAWLRADERAPSGWQLGASLRAIAIIGAGGLLLAHLGGALARSWDGPARRWVFLALPAGLAVLSIVLVALTLETTGLGPFVLETLRAGAAR